ncbi:MAG: bifunctional homocysteine S-methyltransferase/methylenetetrahydrofolate reductase, partial [Cellulosilyticum sp.]|nr:bifunctional homocysteine S-methyltransferase/methylenetetrahydrofolate reductase [Cellulosilyticum sp.]
MTIREHLEAHKVICDGAFGTYYSTLTGTNVLPERANQENPAQVKQIHKEYIRAGATLIRTNTFASNTQALECTTEEVVKEIQIGYQLAQQAVRESSLEGKKIYIAGDIGPISRGGQTIEALKAEYELICDTFLALGAEVLVFETFPDLVMIEDVIRRVKKKKEIFIITQFCINQYGYSASGLSAKKLLEQASQIDAIDAVGFNCGVGPGHLYQILKKLDLTTEKYLTALPNASYPKLSQNRMVFMENMEYFSEQMQEIAKLGMDFIGGCCGTTPKYIETLSKTIDLKPIVHKREQEQREHIVRPKEFIPSFFAHKTSGEKILAVELSPPPDVNYEKIMDAANVLKQMGVDILTFPDSPSGRMRADSILMSVKVANEVKINVLPHICCRDRNAIAIRSELLGAHINGVKNVLVITGDPVPAMARENVKSVFNFDSVGIMKTIQEMNEQQFKEEPVIYGGAVNYNRRNIDAEIHRMNKKIAAGAQFFLSQPIFTLEDADKLHYIKSKVDTKILCGIMPLVSQRNANFIKNEMADIHVTEEIVNLFSPEMSKEQGEAIGVDIARRMIEVTKDFVDGYYFSIPFNRV